MTKALAALVTALSVLLLAAGTVIVVGYRKIAKLVGV